MASGGVTGTDLSIVSVRFDFTFEQCGGMSVVFSTQTHPISALMEFTDFISMLAGLQMAFVLTTRLCCPGIWVARNRSVQQKKFLWSSAIHPFTKERIRSFTSRTHHSFANFIKLDVLLSSLITIDNVPADLIFLYTFHVVCCSRIGEICLRTSHDVSAAWNALHAWQGLWKRLPHLGITRCKCRFSEIWVFIFLFCCPAPRACCRRSFPKRAGSMAGRLHLPCAGRMGVWDRNPARMRGGLLRNHCSRLWCSISASSTG